MNYTVRACGAAYRNWQGEGWYQVRNGLNEPIIEWCEDLEDLVAITDCVMHGKSIVCTPSLIFAYTTSILYLGDAEDPERH